MLTFQFDYIMSYEKNKFLFMALKNIHVENFIQSLSEVKKNSNSIRLL